MLNPNFARTSKSSLVKHSYDVASDKWKAHLAQFGSTCMSDVLREWYIRLE